MNREARSQKTLLDLHLVRQEYNKSYCLMMIATDVITIYKDDTIEREQMAEKAFNDCVAKGQVVKYENRKTSQIKLYNRFTGVTVKPIPHVDFDYLKETIIQLQQKEKYNKKNSKYLKKIWFPFIFRLLDEGALGSQNKDMSGRTFLSFLKENGFKPGGHSNFFEFYT